MIKCLGLLEKQLGLLRVAPFATDSNLHFQNRLFRIRRINYAWQWRNFPFPRIPRVFSLASRETQQFTIQIFPSHATHACFPPCHARRNNSPFKIMFLWLTELFLGIYQMKFRLPTEKSAQLVNIYHSQANTIFVPRKLITPTNRRLLKLYDCTPLWRNRFRKIVHFSAL